MSCSDSTHTASQVRSYKEWKGKNKFFCDGRVIMSADVSTFLFAQLLILGISAGVIALIILKFDTIVLIPYVLLSIVVYSSHIRASCMDPGIIPRNLSEIIPQPPEHDEIEKGVIYKYCRMFRYSKIIPYTTQQLVKFTGTQERNIAGFVTTVLCDLTITVCPWLGNCVGTRNYRYFLIFVLSTLITCLYVTAICISDIVIVMEQRKHEHGLSQVQYFSGSIVLLVLAVIIALSLLPLGVFHLKLLSTGETTNENLRGVFQTKENIDNLGFCGNTHAICCEPIAASQLNLREIIDKTGSPYYSSLEIVTVTKKTPQKLDDRSENANLPDSEQYDNVRGSGKHEYDHLSDNDESEHTVDPPIKLVKENR